MLMSVFDLQELLQITLFDEKFMEMPLVVFEQTVFAVRVIVLYAAYNPPPKESAVLE